MKIMQASATIPSTIKDSPQHDGSDSIPHYVYSTNYFATNIYAHKFVRMWSGTIGGVLKSHMY
jgi:hypothetical protein